MYLGTKWPRMVIMHSNTPDYVIPIRQPEVLPCSWSNLRNSSKGDIWMKTLDKFLSEEHHSLYLNATILVFFPSFRQLKFVFRTAKRKLFLVPHPSRTVTWRSLLLHARSAGQKSRSPPTKSLPRTRHQTRHRMRKRALRTACYRRATYLLSRLDALSGGILFS